MSLAKLLLNCAKLVLLPVGVYVIFILKMMYAYSGNISESVCIRQVILSDKYNLISCSDKRLLVEDVDAWIIYDGYIFGAFEEDEFFAFRLDDHEVVRFSSMGAVNSYLRNRGLETYDMNLEENIYHLKFGNGRNRVY